MFEFKEDVTVEEFVKREKLSKLWLCPHLVSDGTLGNPPWMTGYECSAYSIPEYVKDRKVKKFFREGKLNCIIWFNEDDKPFHKLWDCFK